MPSIIFYGAGQNARKNFAHWTAMGLNPVCFADADVEKHHKFFETFEGLEWREGGGVIVLPLLEAILRYPDYVLYLTQSAENVEAVRDYLLGVGVPGERIMLIV